MEANTLVGMELLFNVYALTIASLQALLPREKC